MDDDREAMRARLDAAFTRGIPHNRALGMETVSFGEGEMTIALPWREDLVGNPETGVLHGGVISALLDAASGAAVFLRLMPNLKRIATLDLRIDYLRPGIARRVIHAHSSCYHLTRQVAFTRAEAFHPEGGGEPRVAVAASVGTFMIFDDDKRSVVR